ncbi:MAG: 3-deoxy-7-phosphoheptulonate synthase, partial [Chloroflexi bacterium]|nr:3-deoxy-7-phosphoheptulonate synthase [Chloroflexota bacterium]
MQTKDLRIETIRPVVSPVVLREEFPLNDEGAGFVSAARDSVVKILAGQDDRLLVVVGPCSIHDPQAALDYARRLADLAATLVSDLYIVMRVYFEKPRTTVGWKGLINDPRLNGTFAVNEGIRAARHLLLDLVTLRLPAGCEFLDPISPQFFADVVTWAAIGARTVESQVHRQLASGLSMPVGFKNGTNGNVQVAADAVRAAAHPHSFLGVTEEGLAAIVTTYGNSDCHIILRGGDTGPNFNTEHVKNSLRLLKKNHLLPRLMIDTSHGNSNKDYHQQPLVTESIAQQVAAGERGIIGLLMESFLVDGRQDLVDGAPLVYG